MKPVLLLLASALISAVAAAESETLPAPTADHVGFPKNYQSDFQTLRTVNREKEGKVVTIYGNAAAASVTNSAQLPYPYGSIIVMESAGALKSADGKFVLNDRGGLTKDKVLGLHVMRREPGFGAAYQTNRTAEWEYVEYRPDGTYITPPQKSAVCAQCHVKAGHEKDFVYRARLGDAK